MKTTFLAMILACTLAAAVLNGQQPAQPGAGGAQGGAQAAPEIKDPNEYNAYVGCIQAKDATAKISCLEAFLKQYPNSVMKMTAMELLMNTYLGAQNQPKVLESAQRILDADACNLRALALLTYLMRPGVPQTLADLTKYSNKGLECISSGQKPAGMSIEDWEKLKKQTAVIFNGGAGFADLQNKDYAKCRTELGAAIEADPNDLQNVYPFAMCHLNDPKSAAPDTDKLGEKGLCYVARAANLATGPAQAQIQEYGRKKYKNYHGSEDGWNGVLLATKSAPFTCPPIPIYIPPTPAQQAHDIVNGKTPEQIQQLSFGEWELVLSAGTPEDQDKVWNVIKGRPLQMEGTVISAHDVGDGADKATEIQIAASEDDIEKKQADITLTMNGVVSARQMPKPGDTLDFEGTPTDYVSAVHAASAPAAAGATTTPAAGSTAPPTDATQAGAPAPGATGTAATPAAQTPAATPAAGGPPVPFMMTMEKGKLLTKAGTPTRKPAAPTRRRPTTRKPQ